MKRKPVFISLACLAVVIVGCTMFYKSNSPAERVTISEDYPKYDSLENLMDRADTILQGKIMDSTCSERNITQNIDSDEEYFNLGGEKDTSTFLYTIYTVEIREIYKGNMEAKGSSRLNNGAAQSEMLNIY